MAGIYKVSNDRSEVEKAVGGILTFAQAGWLALGFLTDGALFLFLALWLPPVAALVLALPPGAVFGGLFAFYTREDLTLFRYLCYRRRFLRKNKTFYNTLTYGSRQDEKETLFR